MLCQAPLEVNKFYPDYQFEAPSIPRGREQAHAQILSHQVGQISDLKRVNEDLSRENQDLKLKNAELMMRLESWKDALLTNVDEKMVQINQQTLELKVKGQNKPRYQPDKDKFTDHEKIIHNLKRELVDERQKNQFLETTLKSYEKELATAISTQKILSGQPGLTDQQLLKIPQPLYHNPAPFSSQYDNHPEYRTNNRDNTFKPIQSKIQKYRDERVEAEKEKEVKTLYEMHIENLEKTYHRGPNGDIIQKPEFLKQKEQQQNLNNDIGKTKNQPTILGTQYFFVNDQEVNLNKQLNHYETQYSSLQQEQHQNDLQNSSKINYDSQQNIQRYYMQPQMQDMLPLPGVHTTMPNNQVFLTSRGGSPQNHRFQNYNNNNCIVGGGVIPRPITVIQNKVTGAYNTQLPGGFVEGNAQLVKDIQQQEEFQRQQVKQNEANQKSINKFLESNNASNATALKRSWRIINDVPDLQETQRKTFY